MNTEDALFMAMLRGGARGSLTASARPLPPLPAPARGVLDEWIDRLERRLRMHGVAHRAVREELCGLLDIEARSALDSRSR